MGRFRPIKSLLHFFYSSRPIKLLLHFFHCFRPIRLLLAFFHCLQWKNVNSNLFGRKQWKKCNSNLIGREVWKKCNSDLIGRKRPTRNSNCIETRIYVRYLLNQSLAKVFQPWQKQQTTTVGLMKTFSPLTILEFMMDRLRVRYTKVRINHRKTWIYEGSVHRLLDCC